MTGQVRDNGDLELVSGDRIRHTDFVAAIKAAMQQRDCADPAARFFHGIAERGVAGLARLQRQKTRDQLQAVLDPVIDFADQELLLIEQQVLLGDRLDQLPVEFA